MCEAAILDFEVVIGEKRLVFQVKIRWDNSVNFFFLFIVIFRNPNSQVQIEIYTSFPVVCCVCTQYTQHLFTKAICDENSLQFVLQLSKFVAVFYQQSH